MRAQDVSRDLLIKWMLSYEIEALDAPNDRDLNNSVVKKVNRLLQKNNCWILISNGIPLSLSTFNARLTDMVQVGPVWTPPEHRNKGFARLLLAYILYREKLRGTKQAILFTDNSAAIKAYFAIGFKKFGNYRLALLKKAMNLPKVEFTSTTVKSEIDLLTKK